MRSISRQYRPHPGIPEPLVYWFAKAFSGAVLFVAVVLALLLTACDGTIPSELKPKAKIPSSPSLAVAGTLVSDTPLLGHLIVCTLGNDPSGSFAATRTPVGSGFDVNATGLLSLLLGTGLCEVVVNDAAGSDGGENVAVTEQNADFTSLTGFFIGINGITPLVNPQNGDSYFINSFHGIVLVYVNTLVVPPPGNQGCTPGYWKQSQHFDSWPVSLTTTFADAGMSFGFTGTLLSGLQAGGGDVNALARHAAAAYLNSFATSGVAFAYTTAEVVDIANGVGLGAGLTIEERKDLLEAANTGAGGCPLN